MRAKQLSADDCEKILIAVIESFYKRHPDVKRAIDTDGLVYGSLSIGTMEIIEAALEKDAADVR